MGQAERKGERSDTVSGNTIGIGSRTVNTFGTQASRNQVVGRKDEPNCFSFGDRGYRRGAELPLLGWRKRVCLHVMDADRCIRGQRQTAPPWLCLCTGAPVAHPAPTVSTMQGEGRLHICRSGKCVIAVRVSKTNALKWEVLTFISDGE